MMRHILIILISLMSSQGWGQLNKGFVQTVPGQVNGLGNFVEVGNKREINYNAQADSLFARFDVMPTVPVKEAISQLFDTLNAYHICCGATDSLDVFYDFGVNTWHNAKLNWVGRKASSPYDATMLDSVIFYPYIGMRRSQYTGSVNSNFNPYTAGKHFKLNNATAGVYIYDNSTYKVAGYQIAANSGSSAYFSFAFGLNKTWNNFAINSTLANITVNAITPTNFKGTVQAIRNNSATTVNLFKGQTKTTRTNSSSGATVPNKNFYVGSMNNNGTNQYTDRSLKSFAWIGGPLTDAQALKLDLELERYKSKALKYYDVTWEETNAYYKTANNERIGFATDIISVRGKYKLATRHDTLYWSHDNGLTYTRKIYMATANQWTSAFIFADKSLIICTTENQVWASKDSLGTLTQLTVKNPNHTNYAFHTPASNLYKGNYFGVLQPPRSFTLHGKEVAIIPSYSSVALGASPANIYICYNADSIKVAYRGGRNLSYRDNGTPSGSNSTGTILGDAGNSLYHRHFHSAFMYGDTIYAQSGDNYLEIMWIKGVYNAVADSFTWSKLIDGWTDATHRNEYMSIGAYPIGDTVYFASDANITGHFGIYKIRISKIGTDTPYEMVNDGVHLFINFYANSDYMIGSTYRKLYYSSDRGKTWKKIYTPLFPKVSDGNYYVYTNIMEPDANGWITMYTNYFQQITGEGNNALWHAPTIMVKPK